MRPSTTSACLHAPPTLGLESGIGINLGGTLELFQAAVGMRLLFACCAAASISINEVFVDFVCRFRR
jgi:hypothetical protein